MGRRRGWPPVAAAGHPSLSRARGKLGADPLHMLFERVAGPVGVDGAPGVLCCGLRVISVDGSATGLLGSGENAAFFGWPRPRPGTGRSRRCDRMRRRSPEPGR